MQPNDTTRTPSIKLCECGCGLPAPISPYNDPKRGYVKGQPRRFIRGHATRMRDVRSLEDRVWEKVNKDGPIHPTLNTPCWIWTGAISSHGYGCILVDDRPQVAHRIAYLLSRGYLPEDKDICHHCDNPPCCNPAHLWEGTEADNMFDMASKGRRVTAPGSRNGFAKLKEADIPIIRRLASEGVIYDEIGERYGITKATVSKIVLYQSWKHVA